MTSGITFEFASMTCPAPGSAADLTQSVFLQFSTSCQIWWALSANTGAPLKWPSISSYPAGALSCHQRPSNHLQPKWLTPRGWPYRPEHPQQLWPGLRASLTGCQPHTPLHPQQSHPRLQSTRNLHRGTSGAPGVQGESLGPTSYLLHKTTLAILGDIACLPNT